jgi:BirA family biotin operon repressor/biotin-[acetyl-CoA-carboxylase] ligase
MKFNIGEKIHFYTTTDSTQNNARDLIECVHDVEDVVNVVIVSGEQLRGYGRRGSLWYSPQGGLWCSVVLEPMLSSTHLKSTHQLSILACSAAVQSIESLYNLNLSIKWPNDIMYKGKKLGGVLVEVYPCYKKDTTYYFPIVGIGINVNNEIAKEIAKIAVSIKEILQYEVNITELLMKLLGTFNYFYYGEYKSSGLSSLIHFYCKKNYLLSHRVKVINADIGKERSDANRDGVIEGVVVGIDNDGKLLLHSEKNSVIEVISGHVEEV